SRRLHARFVYRSRRIAVASALRRRVRLRQPARRRPARPHETCTRLYPTKGDRMPAPSTAGQFLDLLRKSDGVDQSRLEACLRALHAEGRLPEEPGQLAPELVRRGVLTFFQAGRLLVGRYRGFKIGKCRLLERL